MQPLQPRTIELVGVACLGTFTSAFLTFGLTYSKKTLQVVMAVIGAALGGAPLVFLGSSNAKWVYPIGLVLGVPFGRVLARWTDISSVTFRQRGTVSSRMAGTVQKIYFKKPFANIPSLSFADENDMSGDFQLVDQRPDGFDIKYNGTGVKTYTYTAIGVRRIPFQDRADTSD